MAAMLIWFRQGTGAAFAQPPAQPPPPVTMYQPVETDFKSLYEADAANKAQQKWDGDDGYWTWVQRFYNGYDKKVVIVTIHIVDGWNTKSEPLLNGIVKKSDRDALITHLNVTGKRVVGEWAKDNTVRKINTDDVKRWGNQLGEAKKRDTNGGVVALTTALNAMDQEIKNKMNGANPAR